MLLSSAHVARYGLLVAICVGWLVGPAAQAAETIDGVHTAAGVSGRYRLIIPDGASRSNPVGLLLFFHADGNTEEYKSDANDLAARGEASRLAVAALSVPWSGGAGGNPPPTTADECWWAPRAETNGRYVGSWIRNVALDELGNAADMERIYFAGVSGGGDFASEANVLLDFAYGGGSISVCGGDLPRADGGSCSLGTEPPLLDPLPDAGDLPNGAEDDFAYSFDITSADPLQPLAEAAADYYDDLGFRVLYDEPPGGGHCEFNEGLASILDRRVARVASFQPAKGCQRVDVSGFADALIDTVPLQVAQQAIPVDDVKRDKLLGKIQVQLDAIAALRAQIPDEVDLCEPGSDCPKIGLKDITADIQAHLSKLKKKLVPKSVGRNPDAGTRETLLSVNAVSHKAKKAALAEIPVKGRLCR